MVDLKTKKINHEEKKKKRKKAKILTSNGNVVVCNPKRGFLHACCFQFFMSHFVRLVEFNRGATGHEAGTSPERAAAHPHSSQPTSPGRAPASAAHCHFCP